MKPKFKTKLLVAALAAVPMAAMPAATATAQAVVSPSQEIVLSIGKGELVTVPGTMADVFVANDDIADVQVKSQRQLYVFGKAGGETTVYASNERGDVIFSANIRVGSNIGSIDQMLALAMPDAKVGVATMGANTVLLTGTVGAPEDAAEAERLVQAFLGEGANVISRLKTATPLQVNLQVKFAEVNRSLLREIGGNLATIDGSSGFRFGVGTGRSLGGTEQWFANGPLGTGNAVAQSAFVLPDGTEIPGPAVDSRGGTSLSGLGKLFGVDVLGALDLSERLGLVTTITEPNLTALSGETATFLAGGEFPIPIAQGLGQVTVQFRQFGVSLAYTPTVLSNGRISMRVRPEVSELSTQGAITLNGFQVPAITTRRTETTVELGSGQSFMIAGLMSANSQQLLEKAPGLGDVPILGNLFRSRQFRRGETELVIVVTPYLVKPVDAKDIKLPTDGYRSANEFEQLLGFQNNAGKSGEQRPGPVSSQPEAPQPKVSAADPEAIVPSSPEKPRRADKKNRRQERAASAATPGFSL
ncbi:type II and III secretion system protein family protein [Porphyrobacter sp. CACIAM 03H1]|jgi:pilus assembly protein CpaC|uniref:type II and III secretion system protein family protein n=1 Tax=Porphyrobacter sp. CACIAM 03H1 TaxID=2003315 RepID=UPI000B5AA171|nr:type II and III secretion system protein family protein [Porphyrobacter sp. CACIAM 03H1]ASJ90565.1 secretion system protein [Porphyrobacter sp. CACIAM 03H1]